MTRGGLVAFLRKQKLCVQSSLHAHGGPQSAVVGYAVTDDLEIVFDTVSSSRKYTNLIADPRCALAVWDGGEITAQLEGLADVPAGDELERLRAAYFVAFPDGVQRWREWKQLVYVRVRPTWARYSDFSTGTIAEIAL